MSRFIDNLKQASQTAIQPIGFRREKIFSKPRLIVVARLSPINGDIPAGYFIGADAGILNIKKNTEVNKIKKTRLPENIPWGLWLKDINNVGVKQILAVGCDFIVFPLDVQFAVFDDKRIGRVLLVETSLERDLLKTLDKLPVDAVIISDEQTKVAALTWRQLTLFRRFVDISNKPLLVPISVDITDNELQAIWEAGISGVIIDIAAEQQAGKIKTLSHRIDSLAVPLKNKWTKLQAIVPKLGEQAAPIQDEEDEEYLLWAKSDRKII